MSASRWRSFDPLHSCFCCFVLRVYTYLKYWSVKKGIINKIKRQSATWHVYNEIAAAAMPQRDRINLLGRVLRV